MTAAIPPRNRPPLAPRCVGVDPGYAVQKGCAFAWRDASGMWRTDMVHHTTTQRVREVLTEARNAGATTAVIEEMYLGLNPKTFKNLENACGGIEWCARDLGFAILRPTASEWRSVLAIDGIAPRATADAKRMALWFARDLLRGQRVTHDEAEAMAMALWGEVQLKQRSLRHEH